MMKKFWWETKEFALSEPIVFAACSIVNLLWFGALIEVIYK